MTIRWELYDKLGSISVIEAAFLWEEIEPTEALLGNIPHAVSVRQRLINDELKKERSEGINKAFLNYEEFSDPVKEIVIQGRQADADLLYRTDKISEQEKERRHLEAFLKEVTPSERSMALSSLPDRTDIPTEVSLERLRKMAIALGEKPKFLFPDERKSLDKRERDSYLGLIAALLSYTGIANDRNAASRVQNILQRNGSDLDLKTIRGILKGLPKRE